MAATDPFPVNTSGLVSVNYICIRCGGNYVRFVETADEAETIRAYRICVECEHIIESGSPGKT